MVSGKVTYDTLSAESNFHNPSTYRSSRIEGGRHQYRKEIVRRSCNCPLDTAGSHLRRESQLRDGPAQLGLWACLWGWP